jgi:hypothetical protein
MCQSITGRHYDAKAYRGRTDRFEDIRPHPERSGHRTRSSAGGAIGDSHFSMRLDRQHHRRWGEDCQANWRSMLNLA